MSSAGGVKPSESTIALLEDIERRIDPETEEDYKAQWRDFLYGRFDSEIFTPKRKKLSPPTIPYPSVHINDAIEDLDLMMQMQLVGVSAALNHPTISPCLRANYGTGILSTIFGAQVFMMPRQASTLPTTRPCNDPEWMRAMVERGMPDLRAGFGGNVLDFGEYWAELTAPYPKVQKYVAMYQPDQIVFRAWRDAKRGRDISRFGFIARAQSLLTKIVPHSMVMDIWMNQQSL